MTKLIALLIASITLIASPVLGEFLDIQTICDQTPELGLFGQFLRNNSDIYQFYAAQINHTFYLPSDEALASHLKSNGGIFRRASAGSTIQAQYQVEQQLSAINAAQNQKRSVRRTADNKSSPNGNSSVFVAVSTGSKASRKRQFEIPPPQTPGVALFTGGGDTSNILFGDIQCKQGLVQVVDSVFTVPKPTTETLTYTNRTKFLDSVNTAGLGTTLDTTGQITVFAPIDSAFLNQSTLDTDTTKFHVVNDIALYSPLLSDGDVVTTSQGGKLYITVVGDEFFINCVRITQTDAISANGVVHAVEKILKPLSAPPSCGGPVPTNTTGPVQFTGSGPVNKAVNMMVIIGTVCAVVGFFL